MRRSAPVLAVVLLLGLANGAVQGAHKEKGAHGSKHGRGERSSAKSKPKHPVWFVEPGLSVAFERVSTKSPYQLLQTFTRCGASRSFHLRARFVVASQPPSYFLCFRRS